MKNQKGNKMSNETTKAPQGTTKASMYREIEQEENVARGHVEVIEIIAYDFVRMEKILDELTGDDTGRQRKVEKGRAPYFCQDPEDALIFAENNPDVRTETFTVQLRKSMAIKYLDAPRNMKQFKGDLDSQEVELIDVLVEDIPDGEFKDWKMVLAKAKELGITTHGKKRGQLEAEIKEAQNG